MVTINGGAGAINERAKETTMSIIRRAIAGATTVLALGAPIALVTATPAEAATSTNGCRVTPLKPVAERLLVLRNGVWKYDTRVTFTNRVYCTSNRIIRVYDRQLESDGAISHLLGTSNSVRTFTAAGTTTISTVRWLSVIDTEAGADEYYHAVRFRVASADQLSGWTTSENSPIQSV